MWLRLLMLHCQRFFYRQRLITSIQHDGALLAQCWQQSTLLSRKISPSLLCEQVEFLVADLETSSLNSADGEVLSIGWVVIKQGKIQLDSAEHHLLKPKKSVGQSATIHHLRDCELEQGEDLIAVARHFLQQAAGRVLVFHHAPLDMTFLNKASFELFSSPLLLPVIDTLAIEKKKIMRQQDHIKKGELRLAECRSRYNLPAYPAHDALMDALSAAELLLAQINHKGKGCRLKDLD